MFRRLTARTPGAHIHGCCVLDPDRGLFVGHRAFEKPESRVTPVEKNGLWRFLAEMPNLLNSMLPVKDLMGVVSENETNRNDFFAHRRDHFGSVDLQHYTRWAATTRPLRGRKRSAR